MELDDLKDIWARYDKNLKKNLRLNEELLRSVNFDKYNSALRKPMNLEFLNILIQLLLIIILTIVAVHLSDETPYFIMAMTAFLLSGSSLAFSTIKVNRISKLFCYHLNIIHFQKKITLLRIFIKRLRKVEYVLAALMGFILLPLMIKTFSGIDILGNVTVLIPAMFAVLGIGFTAGIWLNIVIYDKGINEADQFLRLIDKFKQEEL